MKVRGGDNVSSGFDLRFREGALAKSGLKYTASPWSLGGGDDQCVLGVIASEGEGFGDEVRGLLGFSRGSSDLYGEMDFSFSFTWAVYLILSARKQAKC